MSDVYTVLDLFSGIGGFSLGLERTGGFETVAFCEIDPFCQKVLKKHWPDVPIHDDVRTIIEFCRTNRIVPDVITGGFPCQPFSHAGKRLGVDDSRYLWPAMFEAIKTLRPTWVIGENVAGLTSMGVQDRPIAVESRTNWRSPSHDFFSGIYTREEYMLLNRICENLEQENYTVQPFVIPACGLDAPHRRDRVWIVANAECAERRSGQSGGHVTNGQNAEREETPSRDGGRDTSSAGGSEDGHQRKGETPHGQRIRPESGAGGEILENSEQYRRHQVEPPIIGRAIGGGAPNTVGEPGSTGGWSWWLPEPDVGRVVNGIPNRVDRLRALGNAVVPQIPEAIGHAILQAEGRVGG